MREFTQHILAAFYGATGWTEDNNYSELNATANGRWRVFNTLFTCLLVPLP